MAATKTVWGIDLGQSALKAIRLRLAGDKVEAVNHFYHEHHRILSQPDADRQALISEAMKKFTDAHDLARETIVVGVPGQNTLARFSKLPPVKPSQIPDIVKYEAQQQIPFDMEEVIWDYQTFEDATTKELQVGIFAMRRELLRSHLSFLSQLNLEPAVVQSSPLALYNALKFDGIIGNEPICVLDIGAQNTDLIIVEGDGLWTRNIPIGGNNFTDALLKTFKLSFNKAENLKRTAASSKYARQIFQAMRPVFADLVAEVQRSIGFYTSSRRGVKLNKVLAMGNAFKLPGMLKFVQQNLGMEVIRPTGFSILSTTEADRPAELMDQLMSYAVAYGLALQGLGKAPITSSLLPPEIAKQVVWRRKTPWFYGAAACLVAAAGVVWARNTMDDSAVQAARGNNARPSYNPQFRPEDTQQLFPQPDPAAVSALASGPQAGSDVEFANAVVAIDSHMGQVLTQIDGKNSEIVQEAQKLSDLQVHKVTWPKILQLVHAALPVGDEELNRALENGPEAYKALLVAHPDKYERAKREKIYIERFEATFSSDVYTLYQSMRASSATAGGPLGQAADASGGAAKPGFVVKILARTPFLGNGNNGGVFFVDRTFLTNLRKAQTTGVYIDRVDPPLWQTRVKDWNVAGISARTSSIGGFGGGMNLSGLGRQEDARDPVTGEPIDDVQFEIMFVAVLGDKPAADPNAGGAAQDGGSDDGA